MGRRTTQCRSWPGRASLRERMLAGPIPSHEGRGAARRGEGARVGAQRSAHPPPIEDSWRRAFGAFSSFVASWFLKSGEEQQNSELQQVRSEFAALRALFEQREVRA